MSRPLHNEENIVWIFLSVLWCLGSIAVWSTTALASEVSQVHSSAITAVALLVFSVSCCLRLPVLTDDPQTTTMEDQFVWLLNATASLNWIGFLALCSADVAELLPAVTLWIVSEVWMYRLSGCRDCLPGLRAGVARVQQLSRNPNSTARSHELALLTTDAHLTATASPVSHQDIADALQSQDGHESVATGLGAEENRAMVDGVDELGNRYLSGQIRLRWQDGLRSQVVVASFCPPFGGQPTVELETEDESVDVQVVNCTPVGMRLSVRVQGTPTGDTTLLWYASIDQDSEASVESASPPPLP